MRAITILLSFLLLIACSWIIYLDETGIYKSPELVISFTVISMTVALIVLMVNLVWSIVEDF